MLCCVRRVCRCMWKVYKADIPGVWQDGDILPVYLQSSSSLLLICYVSGACLAAAEFTSLPFFSSPGNFVSNFPAVLVSCVNGGDAHWDSGHARVNKVMCPMSHAGHTATVSRSLPSLLSWTQSRDFYTLTCSFTLGLMHPYTIWVSYTIR